MCEWGTHKKIEINGRFWKVDACIADMVQILISRGVKTFGCCCGHGEQLKLDGIEHHFHAELMIAAESVHIVKRYGLEVSETYTKITWGIVRNYVNVRLDALFDGDANY